MRAILWTRVYSLNFVVKLCGETRKRGRERKRERSIFVSLGALYWQTVH